MRFPAEVFVALLDDGGSMWLKAFEGFEQLCGIEGFQLEVGLWAIVRSGWGDDDDGNSGLECFELADKIGGGNIFDTRIENNPVDGGEESKCLEGFLAAVCGEDVELCGFDDELAGGDATRELAVDDEKTRSDHGANYALIGVNMPNAADFGRERLFEERNWRDYRIFWSFFSMFVI